jgi:glycosyltransferase involved in cell wall biosynthesis
VISKARLTIATTRETEDVVRSLGARATAVVFPDALRLASDFTEVELARAKQKGSLRKEVQLVFSGRAVWWKGPHLAIRLIHALLVRGINADLNLCSEGVALAHLKESARVLGVEGHIRFRGFVSRDELQQAYRDAHAFVLPSLHESSSSAMLEAYNTGLPSLTLGIGGTATLATDATGCNGWITSADEWISRCVEHIAAWRDDPHAWFGQALAAKRRADEFDYTSLASKVSRLLAPSLFERRLP